MTKFVEIKLGNRFTWEGDSYFKVEPVSQRPSFAGVGRREENMMLHLNNIKYGFCNCFNEETQKFGFIEPEVIVERDIENDS